MILICYFSLISEALVWTLSWSPLEPSWQQHSQVLHNGRQTLLTHLPAETNTLLLVFEYCTVRQCPVLLAEAGLPQTACLVSTFHTTMLQTQRATAERTISLVMRQEQEQEHQSLLSCNIIRLRVHTCRRLGRRGKRDTDHQVRSPLPPPLPCEVATGRRLFVERNPISLQMPGETHL